MRTKVRCAKKMYSTGATNDPPAGAARRHTYRKKRSGASERQVSVACKNVMLDAFAPLLEKIGVDTAENEPQKDLFFNLVVCSVIERKN